MLVVPGEPEELEVLVGTLVEFEVPMGEPEAIVVLEDEQEGLLEQEWEEALSLLACCTVSSARSDQFQLLFASIQHMLQGPVLNARLP